ncbi:MAG: hypothetical protein C5B51_03785 [Terriglobia bacterium]|nr:MAG: hypothetical protein C5B51_03785 [Terriglobia bacterium]
MPRVENAWVLAIGLATAQLVAAQWLNYPTQGVPRNPDGSPNLSAPAPRTSDGKPDLSGLWAPGRIRALNEGLEGQLNATGPFWDFGSVVPGGLPYQPWAAALRNQRFADRSKDNPDVHCMPLGILQMNTHPFPRRFIQAPGYLAILHERDLEYRQIFTDGRPFPKDPQPAWNGYSTAKWVGDTLVVETTGFREGLWADYDGSPLTGEAKITERFRRLNFGSMQLEMTIDDPKAYTKPWTAKLDLALQPDSDLLEYVCLEGERDAAHMVGK